MSGGATWLSMANRADSDTAPEKPGLGGIPNVPLTERDGVTLREEVRDWGALDGDRAGRWKRGVFEFRDYLREKEGVETVFEDVSGNRASGSSPHRFDPDYADRQYAKLKDLERGISAEFGKRLHTAMLTFTASSTDDEGRPRPPVDHLDDLLESWDAIRRALDRVLDGTRYERLAILEPHKSGYAHIHMAVFVDGRVTTRTFEPVIEAHVRNCEPARWEAHDLDDDSTISVRHAGADRDADDDEVLDELAIYLAEYLGTYGEDPRDAPGHVQAFNAVLWASGRQRWRPSNGAQEYMATDSGEADSEWEMVGVEVDGEFMAADPENGGVDRFTTGTDPPPGGP
jgi:hypothetical protein